MGNEERNEETMVYSSLCCIPFAPPMELPHTCFIAACNTAGAIYFLKWNWRNGNVVEVLHQLQLPKAIFSSPLWLDADKVVVGCRDNNLYCIVLNERT